MRQQGEVFIRYQSAKPHVSKILHAYSRNPSKSETGQMNGRGRRYGRTSALKL
jgi:hypothetical protein